MQTQFPQNAQPQFSFQELDQIESAIQASLQWITTLEGRRKSLLAELDHLTQPQSPGPKMIEPGFEYRGAMFSHRYYVDIHVDLLRRLWTDFPDHREAMAKAMAGRGTTRAYVAKTRDQLYPSRPVAWSTRHSRILVDGWYVDLNLNLNQMCSTLSAAVRAAGLTWGSDVTIYWRATRAA